jgi:hypothetical protein
MQVKGLGIIIDLRDAAGDGGLEIERSVGATLQSPQRQICEKFFDS